MAGRDHDNLELTQPRGVILRRIFAMARPYAAYLAVGVVMGMVMSCLNLLRPYLVGSSITATLESLEGGQWTWQSVRPLVWRIILLATATAGAVGLGYANTMLMAHTRMKILTDFRRRIYGKILRQSFSYFDKQETGQLINRTIGDVNMLRMFYTMVLVQGSEIGLLIIGTMAAMFWIDPWVALVALPFVPIYAFAMVLFSKRIHPMFHDMRHEMDRSTQILSENVQGVQVVRAFGREPEEEKRYDQASSGILKRYMRLARNFAVYQPAVFYLGQLGLMSALAITSYRVMQGAIAIGVIYTVFRWSRMLTGNMRMIARMVGTLEHSLVSAERVFEILDAKTEVGTPKKPEPMPDGSGHVVFENVTFGYDDRPVLKDVNLDIPAGTNVALVGPTGSGKSTLIKLLPRFYDPKEGRIVIDGVDISTVQTERLRAEIGFVFQDTFLFSASLSENIAFGVPEAEKRAIEDVARRAGVEEFAATFEEGYDTAVGERGISLSGGQRQRVTIARALLVDPRILILDDATASVDATTERAIQDGLVEVMKDRTTFIIAHRITTVKLADLVLVMDEGRIVQQGTHTELLEQDGPYREFVRMQWQLGIDDEEVNL
ncbi:MAG: ABC transporter ATP-binding protein [Planctomycetota bacterium]|nr:ABC transporter ATP-binding protein [Planctomycetota bacterium]